MEEGRRRVDEPLLGHEVVRLERRLWEKKEKKKRGFRRRSPRVRMRRFSCAFGVYGVTRKWTTIQPFTFVLYQRYTTTKMHAHCSASSTFPCPAPPPNPPNGKPPCQHKPTLRGSAAAQRRRMIVTANERIKKIFNGRASPKRRYHVGIATQGVYTRSIFFSKNGISLATLGCRHSSSPP